VHAEVLPPPRCALLLVFVVDEDEDVYVVVVGGGGGVGVGVLMLRCVLLVSVVHFDGASFSSLT